MRGSEATVDRESFIASALMHLVDALSATESGDVLTAVCDHLAMGVDANAAGILLGDLAHPEFLGVSAPYVRDLLQDASEEFADDVVIVDAIEQRTIDLRATESPCGEVGRDAGIRWVQLLPLRSRGSVVGALAVLRDERGPVPEEDLLLAEAIADVAATAVVQERAARSAAELARQLQHALTSRVAIEQAKGMISERAGIPVDDAFAKLRKYARDHNMQLVELARAVVDHRLSSDAEDILLGRAELR